MLALCCCYIGSIIFMCRQFYKLSWWGAGLAHWEGGAYHLEVLSLVKYLNLYETKLAITVTEAECVPVVPAQTHKHVHLHRSLQAFTDCSKPHCLFMSTNRLLVAATTLTSY